MRRIQGFASIICDTEDYCPNDPRAVYILLARLSGAFTKGAELSIVFAAGLGLTFQLAAFAFTVLPMHLCVHASCAKDP